MDAIRFDALTKAWVAEASRRSLAGMLAAALGALGLAGAEDADAAKSGRCKKTCNQCEFCQKGKCKKKHGKKRCKKGKCKPVERGTPCGDEDCGCTQTIEGHGFCAANVLVLCSGCASSAECGPGARCIPCGTSDTVCVPACGTV
jgi:hypothetical protein